MTVGELMELYKGNARLTILPYCEEMVTEPEDEPWWGEASQREISSWSIIGGGVDPVELYIKIKA